MNKSRKPLAKTQDIAARTEFLLYKTEDGRVRIQTRLEDETVWLSINQMAELFGVDKSGISRHLKNVFESGELSRDSVVAVFATTAADGKTYQVEHYNLDAIISVGYRVNSIRGTQFRIWATQRIREYIVKGFTMDDETNILSKAVGRNKRRFPDDFACRLAAEKLTNLRFQNGTSSSGWGDPPRKQIVFSVRERCARYRTGGRKK